MQWNESRRSDGTAIVLDGGGGSSRQLLLCVECTIAIGESNGIEAILFSVTIDVECVRSIAAAEDDGISRSTATTA